MGLLVSIRAGFALPELDAPNALSPPGPKPRLFKGSGTNRSARNLCSRETHYLLLAFLNRILWAALVKYTKSV